MSICLYVKRCGPTSAKQYNSTQIPITPRTGLPCNYRECVCVCDCAVEWSYWRSHPQNTPPFYTHVHTRIQAHSRILVLISVLSWSEPIKVEGGSLESTCSSHGPLLMTSSGVQPRLLTSAALYQPVHSHDTHTGTRTQRMYPFSSVSLSHTYAHTHTHIFTQHKFYPPSLSLCHRHINRTHTDTQNMFFSLVFSLSLCHTNTLHTHTHTHTLGLVSTTITYHR